ncbi:MAG: Stp1/IreP family PP2C-type Ser/Thr phosphatase [Acidobacteriota bacterium]
MTNLTGKNLCPNCGANENQSDLRYCENCGVKLGSALILHPAPPVPRPNETLIADKFRVESLLWTSPIYNVYAATLNDSPDEHFTIFEQVEELEESQESSSSVQNANKLLGRISGSLEGAAPAFEKFGFFRPVEQIIEGSSIFTVFEQIEGQIVAHLDQRDEKEVRAIGLQLCMLAERFHNHGWSYNGFEPYGVVIDLDGHVRLLSFDRARQIGLPVADAPIYPSRGYTALELFEPEARFDERNDVYAIGALLQSLLAGESLGESASIYPVATVFPNFERLLAQALAEDPKERFQTVRELSDALADLNLPVVLQAGQFTDVGLLRELNEDSILALTLTQYYESVQTQIGLYIVSDGMGGEAAGEVASRVTVRAVAEWVTEKLISASLKSTKEERIAAPTMTGGLRLSVVEGNEMATTEMLRKAVAYANQEVMNYAKRHPDESGLGATCTVAMLVGDVLTIAHVGDSRCYLLSGDNLEQITEDHSVVQKMINTGNLTRIEARVHPYRNVIYRSIGADEMVEVDIIRRKLKIGDTLLLCSDGLNGMLSDDQIRDVLMINPDPNIAAKELVVAANAGGGEDNTSVIVVRIS